ncbi:hypothetical protein [Steroidobacter agaridevorans]|uniref:hypothetical protein n=1 Tax=Steroidobacter agaridevorans TaxID=2695856 RepID=UPI00132A83B9|nr:hypothetical protein [Steroidobacter agaridevorans]GFE89845.1 hypothetical protein GCM10011488_47990 [Steroidobacter agaridevorans]
MRVTVSLAALIAVLTAVSAAHFSVTRDADESSRQSAAPAPAPIDTQMMSSAPSAKEIAFAAPERDRQLALAIERALVSRDSQYLETVFNFVLPELLREEPERVVAMFAQQEPGESRNALRDEVARQWIMKDRDAAIEWMSSLEQADRTASVIIATRALAAINPAQAITLADQFGVGSDDGSLEHIVQIWAAEKPDEAVRWIEGQPPGEPRTAQLRARIEHGRSR